MKIRRFNASRMHGYLGFDVSFYPDLTFLTGINGSGKTSVVRGLSALISPSLRALTSIQYESMATEIEHDGNSVNISAKRENGSIHLASSGVRIRQC